MAKTKLFDNWTWQRHLPEPFDDPSVVKARTDVSSMYNQSRDKKSTLHSAILSAIQAYMELDLAAAAGSTAPGALGTQNGNMTIAEYPSHTGEIHAVVFTHGTGKFSAGRYTNPTSTPQSYTLKEDGSSGAALIFALLPTAMNDTEFADEYGKLLQCKKDGYSDLEEASKTAAVLCDNLYRRIENADNLSQAGIKTSIPKIGNIPALTTLNLNKGAYSPTTTLFGDFEILKPGMAPTATVAATKHEDFVSKYPLSERQLSASEKRMIPELPSWYVVPHEVVRVCQHAKMTTDSSQPMRNFMLRGPAGTGKTEGSKAIAAGLGLPYVHITCSANSEIMDFLGQILPDMKAEKSKPLPEGSSYPSFEDIRMDPPTAYFKLTGEYNEDITEDEVYEKLIEVIGSKAPMEEDPEKEKKQGFKYVDTPLVNAIRYGYCCEIQEPSIIANPGVLVGLNSLLDRCNAITLPTGEKIGRHPDTVIIVTTNNDYNGCKDLNQSVISRMNLVIDIDEPDVETLVKRVTGITGCTDISAVKRMAEAVKEIAERCRETMITDGCCGVRELIAWVQSFMICGNEMEAAQYTVLSSVSADPENRAEILTTCLEPKFST